MIAPLSSSHSALPSDPTHQIHPEPAWDIYREQDMGKPKEHTANGHKKKRLGESRERSASPKKVDRSRREESLKKEFGEGKLKKSDSGKTISAGKMTVKNVGEMGECEYSTVSDSGDRISRSTEANREGNFCTKDIYKDATSEKKAVTALEQSRSDSGGVSKVYSSNMSTSRACTMDQNEKDAEAKCSEFQKESHLHPSSIRSANTAPRKATVSPGPWKIPGSDKLPSTLKSGTSAMSR